MFPSVEVLNLFLYCVQQLGIMLCVGAATISLITFVVATRDGKVEAIEEDFARAVRKALWVGLTTVVGSGILITLLHEGTGGGAIVEEPVFLFKWAMVGVLVALYALLRDKLFPHFLVEGVAGGTWYALFLIHILAPLTSWANLFTLYATIILSFVAVWSAVVKMSRKNISAPQAVTLPSPQPKPVASKPTVKPVPPIAPSAPQAPIVTVAPKAPSIPKPAVVVAAAAPKLVAAPQQPPKPVVVKAPEPPKPPAAPILQKPLPAGPIEQHSPWLPAIHIMPKTEKDLASGAHIITIAAKPKTS